MDGRIVSWQLSRGSSVQLSVDGEGGEITVISGFSPPIITSDSLTGIPQCGYRLNPEKEVDYSGG